MVAGINRSGADFPQPDAAARQGVENCCSDQGRLGRRSDRRLFVGWESGDNPSLPALLTEAEDKPHVRLISSPPWTGKPVGGALACFYRTLFRRMQALYPPTRP